RAVTQPAAEGGDRCQKVVDRLAGSIPEKSAAHQARADRRDVGLGAVAPVDLHEGRPGREPIVAPHAEASLVSPRTAEARFPAHATHEAVEIGRASCRERVYIWVGGGAWKSKTR